VDRFGRRLQLTAEVLVRGYGGFLGRGQRLLTVRHLPFLPDGAARSGHDLHAAGIFGRRLQ
jgi:hypothetical protein